MYFDTHSKVYFIGLFSQAEAYTGRHKTISQMRQILTLTAAAALLLGTSACTNRRATETNAVDTPAVINNDSTTIIVSLDTAATAPVADTTTPAN